METDATQTILAAEEQMTGFVHLWFSLTHALCGATANGHPECAGTGTCGPERWPCATNEWCPECFRPLCPECLRIRVGTARPKLFRWRRLFRGD